MSKEQVVALAIRLFAIFLLIYGIRSVAFVVPFSAIESLSGQAWVLIGVFLLVFLSIVALLWFFPLSIARKLLPASDVKEGEVAVSMNDIDIVAFSVLGIWVLATAIPDAMYWSILWPALPDDLPVNERYFDHLANTISTVLELVIGFWLLLGAKGLRGLIRKMRYAGS